MIRYLRRLIFGAIGKLSAGTVGDGVRINYFSRFTKRTNIGNDCHFNGMKVGGRGMVVFGSGFHSGSACQVITDIHNYHGKALPYDDTYIVRNVTIGENVWIGNNVIILGGVEVGEGAIIQAGSVVVRDIPPLAIAGGHPATVFSSRDSQHYFRLKNHDA